MTEILLWLLASVAVSTALVMMVDRLCGRGRRGDSSEGGRLAPPSPAPAPPLGGCELTMNRVATPEEAAAAMDAIDRGVTA